MEKLTIQKAIAMLLSDKKKGKLKDRKGRPVDPVAYDCVIDRLVWLENKLLQEYDGKDEYEEYIKGMFEVDNMNLNFKDYCYKNYEGYGSNKKNKGKK